EDLRDDVDLLRVAVDPEVERDLALHGDRAFAGDEGAFGAQVDDLHRERGAVGVREVLQARLKVRLETSVTALLRTHEPPRPASRVGASRSPGAPGATWRAFSSSIPGTSFSAGR